MGAIECSADVDGAGVAGSASAAAGDPTLLMAAVNDDVELLVMAVSLGLDIVRITWTSDQTLGLHESR